MISDIISMENFEKKMGNVKIAIVQISSLFGFLKKCKQFCEWMTYQGKIIFVKNAGEKGMYDTDEFSIVKKIFNNLKEESKKYNIAHGRDITTSAAIGKVRCILGKVRF